MIVRVYQRVRATPGLADVIVATDDERVRTAVETHGGRCIMTRPDHPSGTDRLAEVAAGLRCDVVINVQGDEPLIEPAMIDAVLAPFRTERGLEMSTLCRRFEDEAEFKNPNVVKAVVEPQRLRAVLLPRPRAVPSRHRQQRHPGERFQAHRPLRAIAGPRCCGSPRSRRRRSRTSSCSSSCARSSTASASASSRPHFDSIGVDTEADVVRVRAILSAPAVRKAGLPRASVLAGHHAKP